MWLWAVALPASSALPDADIAVRVTKVGSEIVVDVDCPVGAPAAVVWEVLTDYDNMTAYVSNLQYSGVLRRAENVLTVRQRGKATRGPFSFEFDTVREIVLVPFLEIRSRLISGDLKASTFTTRIVDGDGLVHISNSGRYTPNVWVPPLIGPAFIEGETRKQFGEIRTEILRRALRRTAQLTAQRPAR
ncbi:MAG: SRPBCC family protein [Betaproteobacteria bacterium]